MTLALPPVPCPAQQQSAASIAAAVLTIQHARLKLRRELLVALGTGDKRAIAALSLARDTLARIEMGLKAAAPVVVP